MFTSVPGLLLIACCCNCLTAVKVELGQVHSVSSRFVYPGPCLTPKNVSLTDTLLKYYNASLYHDGVIGKIAFYVHFASLLMYVISDDAQVRQYRSIVEIEGYIHQLNKISENDMVRDELWNKGWYTILNYRYPIVHPLTLQVAHYPPLSSLCTRDEHTSGALGLVEAMVSANVGSYPIRADRFINVRDIFPVAVNDAEGDRLNFTHHKYFVEQTLQRIELVIRQNENVPVVFYGRHVSQWVSEVYTINLSVNEIGFIRFRTGGPGLWFIGAHHPASVGYTKTLSELMRLGTDDLIGACWMVNSVATPSRVRTAILSSCRYKWENNRKRTCVFLCQTVRNMDGWDADFACRDLE